MMPEMLELVLQDRFSSTGSSGYLWKEAVQILVYGFL